MSRWSNNKIESSKKEKIKGLEQALKKYPASQRDLEPTGILYLDVLLGGGISRGSFVELCSPTGLGKSSLMANVAKNFCERGLKVFWWDFEHALTTGLMETTGVFPYLNKNFFHMEPITYGDAEEILESLSPEEIPDLIVVDSETSILADKLQGESILTMEPGIKARLSSNFLIKYKGWARKSKVTFVFINQMRVKISFIPGQTVEDSAGGSALKFYCDYRIRMRRVGDLVREEQTMSGLKKVVYGIECAVWTIKNREVRSHIELNFPIIFGRGVSNLQMLKGILVGADLVTSAGSYFKISIPGVFEGNVQGNKGLFDFIKVNKLKIESYIKENDLLFLVREKGD